MELQLKHIACYLPYKLKVFACYNEYELELEEDCNSDSISVRETIDNLHKPILRPLSCLTNDSYDFIYNKECDYPSIEDWINLDVESRFSCKFSHKFWQFLYENHFDLYGLIELKLAIDINTL